MARNYDYNGDPCGEYGAAVRDIERLREELARLRITDAEREAIEYGIAECEATAALCSERPNIDAACTALAALRGLLERTSGKEKTMNKPNDGAEPSLASDGSRPVAWAVEFEGEVEPFCLSFDKSKAINEAGGVGRVFPLWRSPALTDEERHAIAVVRNCAVTRAERFLTQSDAEWDATMVLWRLRERLG